VMNPGEQVVLPDGRTGYYQQRLPDGSAVVVVSEYVVLAPKDANKLKKVSSGR